MGLREGSKRGEEEGEGKVGWGGCSSDLMM